MNRTITITRSWQIYLPETIREKLSLHHPGQMQAEVKNNQLVLTPMHSPVASLAGSLKCYARERTLDIDNIRDEIDYSTW